MVYNNQNSEYDGLLSEGAGCYNATIELIWSQELVCVIVPYNLQWYILSYHIPWGTSEAGIIVP